MGESQYRRRRNVLKALSSFGVVSIAGCIRSDPATDDSGSIADSFAFWKMSDSWQGHMNRYEAETGVSIQHTNMGYEEVINTLQTRLRSGTGAPALSLIEYASLKQVVDTGGLRDLSDWIEEAGLRARYPSWIWEVVSTDEKSYEIPYDIGPANLFYLKDVWDEHGLNDDITERSSVSSQKPKASGDSEEQRSSGNRPQADDDTYRFVNVQSRKVLAGDSASTDDGANVVQWDRDGGDEQRLRVVETDDDTYRIENSNSGYVLAVSDGSTENGASVVQTEWTSGDHQEWRFNPL